MIEYDIIYFWYVNKNEAINIMENSDLKEKQQHYKIMKIF